MLPSLRNRVSLALHPARIALSPVRRGWRGKLASHAAWPVAGDGSGDAWGGMLATLDQVLAQQGWRGARVEVTLADCLARHVLLPWPDGLSRRAEWPAYAGAYWEDRYGGALDDWELRMDNREFGQPALGCGLEKRLLDALRHCLRRHGMRPAALESGFSAAFNRARPLLREKDFLLAVLEPGHCVFASARGGAWNSLRQLRLADLAGPGWPLLAERELLLQGLGKETPVYFHAAPAEVLAGAPAAWNGLRLIPLLPAPAPGAAGGGAAPDGGLP